ncbi:hypothetical protein D3C83_277120 [compost metagenome]
MKTPSVPMKKKPLLFNAAKAWLATKSLMNCAAVSSYEMTTRQSGFVLMTSSASAR